MITRRVLCATGGVLSASGGALARGGDWPAIAARPGNAALHRVAALGADPWPEQGGPFSVAELASARRSYEAGIRGMFHDDLLARLPPRARAAIGNVRLVIPDTAPLSPGFPLQAYAMPDASIVLPLRTVLWFDQYAGLTAYLERRRCPAGLTLCLLYAAMLATRSRAAPRPPGPLTAYGLTNAIYSDPYVMRVSQTLLDSTMLFILAHELGHVAHRHQGDVLPLESQEQEREADADALDIMAFIGVPPLGLPVLFGAMAMLENGQSTHPLSGTRMVAAAQNIDERPRAFLDRAERNPEAMAARVKRVAAEIRAAVPVIDDKELRASLLAKGRGASFASLSALLAEACPP